MHMAALVNIFGMLGRSINDSRATLEMTSRLRAAKRVLQSDLEGLTVLVDPPRDPRQGEGYLEITEGGIGPIVQPFGIAVNSEAGMEDTTVGDFDDILMFTTRSRRGPFVGRYGTGTIHSNEAEVAWFVRGRTLYRRVLLVAPNASLSGGAGGFYGRADISVREESGYPVANTLGDLTKPENRFAHRTWHRYSSGYAVGFPFHPHFYWDWTVSPPRFYPTDWASQIKVDASGSPFYAYLGLPTLRECSYTYSPDSTWDWIAGGPLPRAAGPTGGSPERWINLSPRGTSGFDAWLNPHPWNEVDRDTGTLVLPPPAPPAATPPDTRRYLGPRIAEDVILTNVIGFDVKVWDPGAPVFHGVHHNGTDTTYPGDLADDGHVVRDSDGDRVADSVGSVMVTPGDPGYPLALAHFWEELAKADPLTRDFWYLPVGSDNLYMRNAKWGAYVDMNYAAFAAATYLVPVPTPVPARWYSTFSGPGDTAGSGLARVYDTWSFHYEHDGFSQDDDDGDGTRGDVDDAIDEGTNGFDDNGNGIVDDPTEMETRPPYPVPLRGIQIKIRTFEPDSRQVREVTVRADFAPK